MNSINVTAYRGYSQVIGELSLQQMFHLIQSGAYANKIQDIEKAMQAGDLAKADHIKRQLPFLYPHGQLSDVSPGIQPEAIQRLARAGLR